MSDLYALTQAEWWQGSLIFPMLAAAIAAVAMIRLRPIPRGTMLFFCLTMIAVGLLTIAAASVHSPVWPVFALVLAFMFLGGTADWHGQRTPASL